MAEASFFPLVVVAVILLLTVLHELIHGAVFGWFAPHRYKAIQFGVIWSMLTPYCACIEPLTRRQYIWGAAMPTIIVGFLPAFIAIAMNDWGWFVIALLMVIGGGGDMLIIWKLMTFRVSGKKSTLLRPSYSPWLGGLRAVRRFLSSTTDISEKIYLLCRRSSTCFVGEVLLTLPTKHRSIKPA